MPKIRVTELYVGFRITKFIKLKFSFEKTIKRPNSTERQNGEIHARSALFRSILGTKKRHDGVTAKWNTARSWIFAVFRAASFRFCAMARKFWMRNGRKLLGRRHGSAYTSTKMEGNSALNTSILSFFWKNSAFES